MEGMTPPPVDGAGDEAPLPEEPLPARLLNNAAVLQQASGHTSAALQLLEEAIQVGCRPVQRSVKETELPWQIAWLVSFAP